MFVVKIPFVFVLVSRCEVVVFLLCGWWILHGFSLEGSILNGRHCWIGLESAEFF